MPDSTASQSVGRCQAAARLDEPGLLLYRSNLLGADLAHHQFRRRQYLGQGRDDRSAHRQAGRRCCGSRARAAIIGSMKLDGFATLYLDKLECAEGPLSRPRPGRRDGAQSQSLHLQSQSARRLDRHLPARLCAPYPCRSCPFRCGHRHCRVAKDSEKPDQRRSSASEIGYLPWQRPGIDLGIKLGKMATEHPEYVGVVLGSHGLFTWGKTPRAATTPRCASSTRPPIWLENATRKKPAFGGEARQAARAEAERARPPPCVSCRKFAAASRKDEMKVGHFTDAPEVLEFVNSKQLAAAWRRSAPLAPIISCAPRSAR